MMLKHAGAATMSGRGGRLAAMFLGVVPAFGLLAGCGGAGGEGGGEDEMIVLAVTPTNGQETLVDMSDPELDGKLTLKFSSAPAAESMIDPTNSFNSLTPNVQILNQGFVRVEGTPSVDKQKRTFSFTPAGNVLAPAQYTVTASKFITTPGGKLLNAGLEDFSASWTVGPDIYNPVIRNTSPVANQQDTPIFTPVIITFNESLDPASVVYNQTVFVEDGGTNPPTPLNGSLLLKRNGFDLVFVPDPCVGLPPSTTVVVRLFGAGNVSFIKDKVGNGLVGDPNNANQVSFQFNTKGVKPLPNPQYVPRAWSARFNLFSMAAYAVTNRATYCYDTTMVPWNYFFSGQILDPGFTVAVLQNNAAGRWWDAPASTFRLGLQYGGDFEAKLGQPGEAVLDWRLDTATGHSYIYQIDESDESVAIINTGTGKVEGHFVGVGTPRGIGINGPGTSGNFAMLYVTNYGQGTLTGIPISTIVPGQNICTAIQELRDNTSKRVFMNTGRNPVGVAIEWNGLLRVGCVVNQADNEIQIFDPQTLKPASQTGGVVTANSAYQVGENPIDCGWCPPTTVGAFCYIVNQGGDTNPNGSVSLWWSNTSLVGLFSSNSGTIISTLSDGINVPGRPEADPFALSCYVPNTAGDDIVKADITVLGGGLGAAISLVNGSSREVGPNPTRMTWTGLPGLDTACAALAGTGQVAFWQRESPIGAPALYDRPGVKSVFSQWSQ
jgi:hypothetical protein